LIDWSYENDEAQRLGNETITMPIGSAARDEELGRFQQLVCNDLSIIPLFTQFDTRIGFTSAVDVVPNLVPTGFKLQPFVMWTHVAITRFVVGNIFYSDLLWRVRLVAFLGGNVGGALAKVRVRDIGIELFLATHREIFCAISRGGIHASAAAPGHRNTRGPGHDPFRGA
jgi:hypothetical protein